MLEEIDYSEEAKYDLFESVKRDRLDLAKCILSRMPPSYEDLKKELEKKDVSISEKEYKKICKEFNFSL